MLHGYMGIPSLQIGRAGFNCLLEQMPELVTLQQMLQVCNAWVNCPEQD